MNLIYGITKFSKLTEWVKNRMEGGPDSLRPPQKDFVILSMSKDQFGLPFRATEGRPTKFPNFPNYYISE